MIEIVYDTVKIGIECGISPLEIWDYTLDEITDYINGYRKRSQSELQNQAALVYKLGTLMMAGFNDPSKYPPLEQVFPGMFDEVLEASKEEQEANNWFRQKVYMEDFMIRHNAKFKKEMG